MIAIALSMVVSDYNRDAIVICTESVAVWQGPQVFIIPKTYAKAYKLNQLHNFMNPVNFKWQWSMMIPWKRMIIRRTFESCTRLHNTLMDSTRLYFVDKSPCEHCMTNSKTCLERPPASKDRFSCTDSQVYKETALWIAKTSLQRPRLFAQGVIVLERFYCSIQNPMESILACQPALSTECTGLDDDHTSLAWCYTFHPCHVMPPATACCHENTCQHARHRSAERCYTVCWCLAGSLSSFGFLQNTQLAHVWKVCQPHRNAGETWTTHTNLC